MKILITPNKKRRCELIIGSYIIGINICKLEFEFYKGHISNSDLVEFAKKLNLDLTTNSKFWEELYIRIPNGGLELNTDELLDRLQYYFLKNHKRKKSYRIKIIN